MKKIVATLVIIGFANYTTTMEHQEIIPPIVRSRLVSVDNRTNKNITIMAPDGQTLLISAGEKKSGDALLNLDPHQGEKNNSVVLDSDTKQILAFVDISFTMLNQIVAGHTNQNHVKQLLKVMASILQGKSTFHATIPLANWTKEYYSDEFSDGQESWDFDVYLVLSGDNLGGSSIYFARRVKNTR